MDSIIHATKSRRIELKPHMHFKFINWLEAYLEDQPKTGSTTLDKEEKQQNYKL